MKKFFIVFFDSLNIPSCGIVPPFIFLERTKQKSVVALESLRFQGRSPQQGTLRVINV
jgi:hypothetical protein